MLFQAPRSPYQVGGSLPPTASTYVERQADESLLQALLTGQFCYVFNARQMGKSSLRVRTMARLQQAGVQSLAIDLTSIGSQQVTSEQWYAAIAGYLVKGLQLNISLSDWWRQRSHLPVVARLADLIDTVLLDKVRGTLVILIDEIDSILGLNFPTDDFFALIRTCINRRAEDPRYRRLTFALFGVTTPSELIADKTRTPFNVGQAIHLQGFSIAECQQLADGLREWVQNADTVLQRILYWTGGQPFLTQKLCHHVVEATSHPDEGLVHLPTAWIDALVQGQLLENWEMQDEPQHLRTIRDRLWRKPHKVSQVLSLYQQVLDAETLGRPSVVVDDSAVQLELLLIGLVEKRQGYLWVKNRIYRTVFNTIWIDHQLRDLRPYSQTFQAWLNSAFQDESRLLRGQALKETLRWAQHQSLSDLEYRFLAASQEIDRRETIAKIEAARLQEVEARLTLERQRSQEQQRSLQRQRLLTGSVSIAMLVAVSLGFFAQSQSHQSALSEAQSTVRTAEALFASDQTFEALLEAVRGKRRLEQKRRVDPELEAQADAILERIILSIHQRNRFDGHTAAVMTADFSPDGQLLATAGVDTTVKLWRPDGTLFKTLRGHQGNVRNVQFSPDGQWLASAGDAGKVQLWTVTGERVRTFRTDFQGIWGLAFSADSQTLVVGGPSHPLEIWHIDGRRITLVDTQNSPLGVRFIAYSPQGDRFAVGSSDGSITLWSPAGERLQTLEGHTESVHTLAFSPEGDRLVSGSVDNTIKLWNRDGTLLKTLVHHEATVEGVAFSPDGQTFVSASHDKTLALWNRDGHLLKTLRGHQAIVWNVAFSADGESIASVGADNTVLLWQAQNPFQQKFQGLPSTHFLRALYSHDGQKLALSSTNNGILLLCPTEFTFEKVDAGQTSVTNLAAHPTLDQFISAGENGTLKHWDHAGNLLNTVEQSSTVFLGVDWHPHGQEFVGVTAFGNLHRWRAQGDPLPSWPAAPIPIWDVQYSPDGRLLATAANNGTAQLWSRDGQLLQTLRHESAVWRVAFNPRGTLLATSSGDNTAKIWQLDGTLVSTLSGHESAVWGIAFSPDGTLVATSSIDETVKLWTPEGNLLATLANHQSGVRSLVFRPDGQVLTSLGDEGSLVHWQLDNILQLEPLTYACNWMQDFFRTNALVDESDRALCES